MTINLSLQPNCSEFCFRIPVESIDEKQQKKLQKIMEKLSEAKYNLKEYIEWFGMEELGDEPFEPYNHDVYFYHGTTMGRRCITLKGDSGDHGEFVTRVLHNLGVTDYYSDED